MNPTFNHVDTFRRSGEGTYNALTVTLNKRMSHGFQAAGQLHLAKGEDNAPAHRHLRGGQRRRPPLRSDEHRPRQGRRAVQPDPHLRAQRPARAQGVGRRRSARLAQQQPARLHRCSANSGLPFNIRSNRDLNLDGVTERPAPRHRPQHRPPRAGPQRRRALRALHPARTRCGPSCSSRPRTSSTPAARIRRTTRPARSTSRR